MVPWGEYPRKYVDTRVTYSSLWGADDTCCLFLPAQARDCADVFIYIYRAALVESAHKYGPWLRITQHVNTVYQHSHSTIHCEVDNEVRLPGFKALFILKGIQQGLANWSFSLRREVPLLLRHGIAANWTAPLCKSRSPKRLRDLLCPNFHLGGRII